MKKNHVLAALLSAAMMLALVLVPAHIALAQNAMSFNAYDASTLKLFFEQTDSAGVKNGDKLFENYEPNDPSTWVAGDTPVVSWTAQGRVKALDLVSDDCELYGVLNVSGMTELTEIECRGGKLNILNASGCEKLKKVNVSHNALTTVILEGCADLKDLDVSFNKLTKLSVPGGLKILRCASNPLAKADLSCMTAPETIELDNCPLRELHTDIGGVKVDLATDGHGCFDFRYGEDTKGGLFNVRTMADDGYEFDGWYNAEGKPVFTDEDCDLWADGTKTLSLTAEFKDEETEPDPSEPDPSEPAEPSEPDPSEPAEPSEPADPSQPGVPTTGSYGMTLLGAAVTALGAFGGAIGIVLLEQRRYGVAVSRRQHGK